MHVATSRTCRVALAFGFLLSLCAVSQAHADTITLMWDPNAGTVTGYFVYVGSQPVDVGNTTSFTLTTAAAGQQYCFSVSAYNASGEGPKSSQVCGYSNQFPTLTKPANLTSTVGQSASLQLVGNDPDGKPITYSATGLPPGMAVGTATGFIAGTPTTAGSYSVTAGVFDGVLNSSPQVFTWTVSPGAADTTAPLISIVTPTPNSSYISTTTNVSLGGTASDGVGVTAVTWANSRGGSGVASGTTNWSVPTIGLQDGTNVITMTARDGAGNVGTDVLTVTYSAPDVTPPTVTISGPTSAATWTSTSSVLTISGTASDNVGVTQVTWATDRGGAGTASGTTNWSASGVALQSGANVVTVTARDAAGKQSTDTLTVTYTPPDTTAPSISILGPTSASSYPTTSSVVTLGGTSSDNMGVTAVTWANDRGGSGFSSGTTSWSIPSVSLQGGTNVITVTAQDAAGNKGTDVLTVTVATPDTTAPTVTISGPTSLDNYTTNSSTFAIGGTAADNVGVMQVSWQNDRGGSGTASGTGTWSVTGMTLSLGTNVITVIARDAAGNQASDVLTVSYSAPAPAPIPTPTPSIVLSGRLYESGRWVKAYLQWSIIQGRYIDVYRNGSRINRTSNDGSTSDSARGSGPFNYRVCVSGTNVCSNTLTLTR
jgi:hypothetical protein